MPESKQITDRIAAEALKKAQAITAKARDQAGTVLEEARAQALEYWQGAQERAKREAEEEQKRIISAAMLEKKKMILDARRKIISKVFDNAADRIRNLADKEYEEYIKNLIVRYAEGQSAELFIAYKDQDRFSATFIDEVNEALARSGKNTVISYSRKDHDIYEGFVLSSGKYQIDVSLKSIIDMHKEKLEADVVKMLF